MIKKLTKQIWNSRRSNGWIFMELLVIFIATWFVIDPLYTLLYQTKVLPVGCDPHHVFSLKIEMASENEEGNVADTTADEQHLKNYQTILELVKNYPGVLYVAPVTNRYLWSGSYASFSFMSIEDTTKTMSAQVFTYFKDTDYFKIFRFKDVDTKRWDLLDSVPYTGNGAFITQNAEEQLFGIGKGMGKEFTSPWDKTKKYKVMGVLENYKGNAAYQPSPCIILPNQSSVMSDPEELVDVIKKNSASMVFRIADGADASVFLSEFRREVLPAMTVGNLYVTEIISLEELQENDLYGEQVPNTIFLQVTLALFFMINICLAVFATFWLRIKKRRSEIGLMLAMGSTKTGVRNYFISESLVIFALASIAGVIILIQVVYFKGMYFLGDDNFTTSFGVGWPINHYVAHFVFVTIIVMMIEGATVLFGTWLSVRNAANILPADALREE